MSLPCVSPTPGAPWTKSPTGVDTFAYGVARDDGLFYPSRVGQDLVSSLCIEAVEILVKYDTYPSAGMASRQVDP